MGTIANQKNGSNIQLEIQAIGTSETSIMLTQPLLGTSSDSYTVEVTQLMTSLGDERALSGTEMIFAVVDRPDPAQVAQIDLTNYTYFKNLGFDEVTAWNDTVDNVAAPYVGGYNPAPVLFENIIAYSATDFIYRLRQQINRTDFGNVQVNNLPVALTLELGVSPSGQMLLIGNNVFWSTKMIVVGAMMKAVSGFGDIIMGTTQGIITARDNDEFPIAAYAPAVPGPRRFYSKTTDSAWETIDRRKRIRIDLSVPIGLTLGWKDTVNVKTYSLQEFYFPRNLNTCSWNDPYATIKETQLVGTTEFVNGGGKLALKRLFPGPVQVIRLALILIYEQYDPINKTWVDKEKPLSMSSGDFFYLKVQFNKEST